MKPLIATAALVAVTAMLAAPANAGNYSTTVFIALALAGGRNVLIGCNNINEGEICLLNL